LVTGIASISFASSPVRAAGAETIDDLRREANDTLLRGEFDRARREFEEILRRVPGDPSAQRDAARAAQAAGQFEYAAQALERAHHFEEHKRDPEVHYLRGEALYTLDRPEEARREHRIAELEIGREPEGRMEKLWLARVYARRGWLVLADGIYDPMWPATPGKDTEVALNQADGHLMNKDWDGGAAVLRRYLEREPKNVRAREMLAWALEASGKLDEEILIRRGLAEDEPTSANKLDYGRALERGASFQAARDQYRAALAAAAPSDASGPLMTSFSRMLFRTTPEVTGGGQFRADPQAWAWRVQAGGAIPFGTRHVASVLAWHDSATDWAANLPNSAGDSTLQGSGSVTGLGATMFLATRAGGYALGGLDGRFSSNIVKDNHGVVYRQDSGVTGGVFLEGDLPFGSIAELNAHADLNEQWAEAPITIHEGGTTTGGIFNFFLFPPNRFVLFDAGLQIRGLSIDPQSPSNPRPTASQQLYFGGIDFNLWSSPARIVRGEGLDEHLARRVYLTDAGILAYRHYELFTDAGPDFRIALAPRASINNGTLIVRKVVADGRIGFDLHGGLGYDTARLRVLSQAGASLVLAASWRSRFIASYDMTRETATGLIGTLHIGWLSYHADL
jgi:tetratricopeptide (TPR) repeat protein